MRRLNRHKLVRDLNTLCNSLHNGYHVNYGGCCYLAYLISEELERFNIEYDLVVYDSYRKDRLCIEHEVIQCSQNKKFTESTTGKHTCDHYCLRIRGAGMVNVHGRGTYEYIIPEVRSSSIKWLYKKGHWNDLYPRSNNGTIRRMVKEFFRKYDC